MLEFIIPAIALCSSLLIWYMYGRDAAGRGIVVTEYEPPLNLSPAEIGVLYDYEATDKEITATLVDLALRKYIAIRRLEKRHFLGTHKVYEFELINDDVLQLKDHEKALLDGLFGVVGAKFTASMQAKITDPVAKQKAMSQYPAGKTSLVGSRITLAELEPYFYKNVEEAKSGLFNSLTNAGYFKVNPIASGADFILVAMACFVAAALYRNYYAASFVVSGLVFILFGLLMKARTKRGQIVNESVRGFMAFLQVTMQDRLDATQGPGSAKNTAGGVELYEKYLPYAIALGIENDWTNKFTDAFSEDVLLSLSVPITDVSYLADSITALFSSDTP